MTIVTLNHMAESATSQAPTYITEGTTVSKKIRNLFDKVNFTKTLQADQRNRF